MVLQCFNSLKVPRIKKSFNFRRFDDDIQIRRPIHQTINRTIRDIDWLIGLKQVDPILVNLQSQGTDNTRAFANRHVVQRNDNEIIRASLAAADY